MSRRIEGGRPSLTSLVAFFLFVLPLVYVLSYAPVFRFTVDHDHHVLFEMPPRESWQELYVPVEWLTDTPALHEPLLNWAGLWGEYVRGDFYYRSHCRTTGACDPYPD